MDAVALGRKLSCELTGRGRRAISRENAAAPMGGNEKAGWPIPHSPLNFS
jgi:hypothetical protein